MTNTLLGGLSAEEFLAEYWQKKPLLVRQAVPGFTGVVTRDELFQLARDPDVESRYVTHDNHDWEVIREIQKANGVEYTELTVGIDGLMTRSARVRGFTASWSATSISL